ncbi:MAG: hypothetical protein JJ992_04555, partial [Planctomycetes bacterium]|nr:hypothetical protein [Planctomycetota bacterium]
MTYARSDNFMHLSPLHYFPLTWPYSLALLVLLGILVVLVQLQIVMYVYEKLGVHPRYVMAILVLSLMLVASTSVVLAGQPGDGEKGPPGVTEPVGTCGVPA